MKNKLAGINPEAFAFLSGLIYLALINPQNDHFSLCLFKLAGIDFCPGCGLGRSISWLLHFNISESLHTHILGIPAFLIIVYRIVYLIWNHPASLSKVNNSFVPGGIQQQ